MIDLFLLLLSVASLFLSLCVFFSLVFLNLLFHSFFFFNDTATTEIYTLSLHDALPILLDCADGRCRPILRIPRCPIEPHLQLGGAGPFYGGEVWICSWLHERRGQRPWQCADYRFPKLKRSEEHTSELQSLTNLVCRLLLEKKKKKK